jgi:NADH-quinone oxidoreductase subunit J
MLDTFFFYVFALMTLGGAVFTVTRKSAVHSAIWLIVSLAGVAGLYLLQDAQFLFVVQIMLYVGGIMVLFLFVIMLVNLDEAAKVRQFRKQWWLGFGCVAVGAVEVLYALRKGAAGFQLAGPAAEAPAAEGNVERIATVLFSQYLLPFEVASVLLLVAVVGSVVMAKKRS